MAERRLAVGVVMKKRTLAGGLVAAALALIVASGANATVMIEYSLEELVRSSDVIVHATVTHSDVRMELREGGMEPQTVTTLRVQDWIAGGESVDGDTVTLRELGGIWNGGGLWYSGTPHYTVGEEVVVFLERRPEAPHDLRTFGMAQGKFVVGHGVGTVPSTVRRDLDGISFARWSEGQQTVTHPGQEPEMQLDVFVEYVRQIRASYGGGR